MITRDGTEHLIPNEMMITEKVVNWSFSDEKVRVRIPFGVSYTSDIHKAMELALRAVEEDRRILTDPPAAVRLTEYGDNSVNFELRVWIVDPTDGLGNIRSAFYVRIWELFKENGIEFPYPQRDVHIKELPPLEVCEKRLGRLTLVAADLRPAKMDLQKEWARSEILLPDDKELYGSRSLTMDFSSLSSFSVAVIFSLLKSLISRPSIIDGPDPSLLIGYE